MPEFERLQKYLARAGIASRRKGEELIRTGRVEINGQVVTELGTKVDPQRDRIKVDGRIVGKAEKHVYYLLHKPRGVTTTASDEYGRRTVIDLVPEIRERVYPVGRLDRESEGLLVLTNDGDLAYYMTHPSFGVQKVYRVTVEGEITAQTLQDLVQKGKRVGPVLIKPQAAHLVKALPESTIIEITVGEGVNREIRRLFAAMGHEVKRLLRIEEGPLSLKGLGKAQYRPLHAGELAQLRQGMKKAMAGEAPAPAPEKRSRVFNKAALRQGKPDPAATRKGIKPRRPEAPPPEPEPVREEKPPREAPPAAHPLSRPARPERSRPRGERPGSERGGRNEDRGRPERGGRYEDRGRPERGGGRNEDRGRPERGGGRYEDRGRPERGGGRNEDRGRPERAGGRYEDRGRPERGGGRYEDRGRPERGGGRYEERGRPERGGGRYEERGRPERGGGRNEDRGRPERGGGRFEDRGGSERGGGRYEERGRSERGGGRYEDRGRPDRGRAENYGRPRRDEKPGATYQGRGQRSQRAPGVERYDDAAYGGGPRGERPRPSNARPSQNRPGGRTSGRPEAPGQRNARGGRPTPPPRKPGGKPRGKPGDRGQGR